MFGQMERLDYTEVISNHKLWMHGCKCRLPLLFLWPDKATINMKQRCWIENTLQRTLSPDHCF